MNEQESIKRDRLARIKEILLNRLVGHYETIFSEKLSPSVIAWAVRAKLEEEKFKVVKEALSHLSAEDLVMALTLFAPGEKPAEPEPPPPPPPEPIKLPEPARVVIKHKKR